MAKHQVIQQFCIKVKELSNEVALQSNPLVTGAMGRGSAGLLHICLPDIINEHPRR
jgi:hypothetical protein